MKPAHLARWTTERVDRLRELWAEGLSCSQIADEMGGGLTRCGVIGKVHRLNLPTRAKPTTEKKAERKKHQPRAPSLPPAPEKPYVPNPTHILDLTSHHCRYPLWGHEDAPSFIYCGNEPVPGHVWCVHHFVLVYQPAPNPKSETAETEREAA